MKKILITGAGGAIGRPLISTLVDRGHEVVGTTRSPAKRAALEKLGATSVLLDALDPDQVARVVAEHEPQVIIHQATALGGQMDLKHFDRFFAVTNRLRTEGTDHLLAAGRAVGVERFIAQSYAGWPFTRTNGGPLRTEDDPLDPSPVAAMASTGDAVRHLEHAVTSAEWTTGIALRYGGFYGPGTSLDRSGGDHIDAVRKRQFPVVGRGQGVWSFIHVADAAEATALAVERGERGIYQIVDDTQAPVAEWLPKVAEAVGAKPPRHVPRWLGRLFAGEAAAVMMTEMRGASNAKAKAVLGWTPRHPNMPDYLAGRDPVEALAA